MNTLVNRITFFDTINRKKAYRCVETNYITFEDNSPSFETFFVLVEELNPYFIQLKTIDCSEDKIDYYVTNLIDIGWSKIPLRFSKEDNIFKKLKDLLFFAHDESVEIEFELLDKNYSKIVSVIFYYDDCPNALFGDDPSILTIDYLKRVKNRLPNCVIIGKDPFNPWKKKTII